MRAVLINDYGPSENLVVSDVPRPELGAGEVLVKVAYGGLRWGDIMQRNGFPSRARKPPFIAGQEASGVIEAVGTDVYVRDMQRGVTVRVSESMPGPGVPSDSPVSMSGDGRLFGFDSIAGDLVGGDTNGGFDAFVYDVERNLVRLASVNAAGTGSGNSGSYGPLLSANGRVAAFQSNASDLVAGDMNGKLDVFVRSLR